MRKLIIQVFLIAIILSCQALAMVEDSKVKGVIPFELKEHLIVIKGKINDSQKQYHFLLDTGGLTFIDQEVVKELDLKTRGNMAKLNMLEMGEVRIPDIFAIMGFNLDEFKKYGVTLHGIIGSNLLERFMVTFDYRNKRVILSPDKEETGESAIGYNFKFTNHPINNAPMIECKVNDNVLIKAMVDTGQPYSIAFPLKYLDELNARHSQDLVKSKGVMIKWPGTKTIDSYLWRINQYEQGNLRTKNLMVCFAELPPLLSVPLIGKDYLCQFLMTIDYPNDEILMVPYEDAQFIENQFSFGVNLKRGENNNIFVEGLWAGGPADKAGIRTGDEVVECNSTAFKSDDIFKLRQLFEDQNVKSVNLVLKNKEGQREVSIKKEMLLVSPEQTQQSITLTKEKMHQFLLTAEIVNSKEISNKIFF